MKIFKFVVATACIGLAATFAATLYAGDGTTPAPTPAPPSTPAPKPLMAALNAIGVGDALNKANLAFYGYAEGGYFHDFSAPKNNEGPNYIGLNNTKNDPELNKIDLTMERTIDQTKKQFDLGFRVEGLWGTDAPLIHSRGLLDNQSGRYQWDLIQAYVDIAFPSIPLRLRVGKWIELAGFEQFSANIYGAFGDPARALYSFSYQFLYAEPGTQTGALATYVVNSKLSLDAGITRGWNQSLQSNGTADFLGRITWTPSDKTTVIFVMTEGPEFPTGVGKGQPHADHRDSWTALDLVITQKITDALSLGFGGDYVDAPHIPGHSGAQQWGGTAAYVSYAINPYLTFNGRGEWYHDTSGFSLGAPVGADYFEGTVGVAIKPVPHNPIMSNLIIRPEFRYDTANRNVFGNGDRNQWTFSVDALITF